MRSHFEEIVQNFELERVGGAPKSHQLTPLRVGSGNIATIISLIPSMENIVTQVGSNTLGICGTHNSLSLQDQ